MSSSFSANQAPRTLRGSTKFVADNRGHLLPGMGKQGSAWPNFKGTWDLPARIPAQRINPTSRSAEGLERLKAWGLDPQHIGNSEPQRGRRNADALQNATKQKTRGVQQDGGIAPSSPASASDAQPASHSRPISADRRTGSASQDTQPSEASSVRVPAEDGENSGGTVTSSPRSQRTTSALKLAT
ncbi:protein Flattop isoform X2 [Syngnathoides biaculeatus]|uniref:protein Flattop isoform X2 n=1 Tax=Syngnathoides biaculeatus TaxID=300417 RepID=UPI002ADE57DF|nr:protein Flattop isoform X2 [Syngnathoides biaculeatus]